MPEPARNWPDHPAARHAPGRLSGSCSSARRARVTGAGCRGEVHVGLGSNLDGPARQVAAALQRLAAWPGVSGLRASRLYRSPPWGVQNQPEFINAVARFDYGGSACGLLASLLAIEREAGRVRGGERWGPRVLDLDLLDFAGRQSLPGLACRIRGSASAPSSCCPCSSSARSCTCPAWDLSPPWRRRSTVRAWLR